MAGFLLLRMRQERLLSCEQEGQCSGANWGEKMGAEGVPDSLRHFVWHVLGRMRESGVSELEVEAESREYSAARFECFGKKCLFRQAKTTPKKAGQFVTIWKRVEPEAPIAPFDIADPVDIVVVAVQDAENRGYFVFGKALLARKRVFSNGAKEGKRAMRVYAPWVEVTSAQARRTQAWQGACFVSVPVVGDAQYLAELFYAPSV